MVGPPVFHKLSHHPVHIRGKSLNERSIARKSQLLEVPHVFTAFPRKHLKNAYESVTSSILVTLHEGGGHCCNSAQNHPRKSDTEVSAGNSAHLPPSAATESSVSRRSSASLFKKRILKSLHLHFCFSHFFQHNIVRRAEVIEIFFNFLISGGQSPLATLNLCQFRTSSVKLCTQLSIIIL
jgi:hypothetical protein